MKQCFGREIIQKKSVFILRHSFFDIDERLIINTLFLKHCLAQILQIVR